MPPTTAPGSRLFRGGAIGYLVFAGVLNLVALPAALAQGRLRALTVVNLAFCGLLFVICVVARFPPPMVFALLIEVLFFLSLLGQRRRA
jgi:hypothetical protein